MLRKIGFHQRGSSHKHPSEPDHGSHFLAERPEQARRANSAASEDLLESVPIELRNGVHGRSASDASSGFPGAERQAISRSTSPNPQHDPFGLQLVYDALDPSGDIVFVHGLGGTAWRSWSWNRDVENFWPIWLAQEDDLSSYRIFTFGYNSNFKGVGTNLNIVDFAKDLLFQMLIFSGGVGHARIPIGHRPLILVAHSMGGLVVKKAYVLGKNDREYADIISRVHGIIFLATPHRGTQFAKILNNILSTTLLGVPPKAYVADLDIHSNALQDINEQFRVVCGDLALVSFFETLKTGFGLTKILIVEKESAILGYPGEASSPLNADHHTICKFRSPEDNNYVSVKNTLKLWASRIHPKRPDYQLRRLASNRDWIKKAEDILGIYELVEDELSTYRSRVMNGTCQWITWRQSYVEWAERSEKLGNNRIFWLTGFPATGKTTLAGVVIDNLKSVGEDCQYHFFSSNHQDKRTAAYCLRSIAYQLARLSEEFRDRLISFHEESGIVFTSQNQNFSVIWEKIFEGMIFKIRFPKPLFWILDAVDEADYQSLLIGHFMRIQSSTPIKLFLTSRPMKLPSEATVYGSSISTCFLSEDDTMDDIRVYVHTAVRDALPHDERVQEEIIDQVLAKASGSFLWVKLALETLRHNWHTQDDICKALTEVPKGMETLYERMLSIIEAQPPRLQAMAHRILTWVTCCWRPLSITEMQSALEPEFTGFVKLEETIVQICGNFISVDNSKISLIHATARHFLLHDRDGGPAFINSQRGHEHIAMGCLRYLSNDDWRRVFKAGQRSTEAGHLSSKKLHLLVAEKDHPLLGYATRRWAYHVSRSPLRSQALLSTLHNFLNSYCLSWIEAIALSANLRYMIQSARYLKAYTKRKPRLNLNTPDAPISLITYPQEDMQVLESWAVDFIRIVGKFGPNLVQSPSSAYSLIPAFCPRDSMVGTTYASAKENRISIAGLSSGGWDDCLASVSVGDDVIASKVLSTNTYFITLISSSGAIVIWYAETCQLARTLVHGEYVSLMTLNKSQTLLVTSGIKTYRVWDISSGKEVYCIPREAQALTMAISFDDADCGLLIGLDDCSVTSYNLTDSQINWHIVVQDPRDPLQGCPRIMVFSPDLKKIAVAWRGKPPLILDVTTDKYRHHQRCKVTSSTDAVCAPEKIQWQPDGSAILILCENTTIIEWHLYDNEQHSFGHVKSRNMTISQDGNFLLTCDHMGTMSVWTFPRLNLIYQLINQNEFIRGLAFSPDGQRFYDLRESTCNVWEPDALIRADEHDLDDQSSIGESFATTEPAISRDEVSQSQVTALASDYEDRYYCCGREDGTVVIHDSVEGSKVRKVYSHSSTSCVTNLVWSCSGRYMVSGDDSGRVMAKRLEAKKVGKWAVFPVLEFRLDEPVQQFLFSEHEKLLLVSTPSMDCVWDLKAKQETCRRNWGTRQSRRWIGHPLNAGLIVWIDPVEVHTYSWTTLEHSEPMLMTPMKPTTSIQNPRHAQISVPTGSHVQWIALTKDKRHIVYQTIHDHSDRTSPCSLHLEFLSTSDLRIQHPHSLTSNCMADLAGRVLRLVGTYEDQIVFLDHDYWVCIWKIDASFHEIERQFFLPRDWLNTGGLQMATLNTQGTFFCPKYGEVAIVRNGIRQ